MAAPNLPGGYRLVEVDTDILVLRGPGERFVAAFSADGATPEGIERAVRDDQGYDHPQALLAQALDERPPVSQERRERYRERLAAALLRELYEVIQTLNDVALGSPRRRGSGK